VQVASNETNYAQGSSETTANSTDMQLNGNGSCLERRRQQRADACGDFSLGSNGNLISSDGMT